MGVEPHTLESFDALPDDGARNAAIARALGCTFDPTGHRYNPYPHWHTATGDMVIACPHYYTGGDSDPFANWGLLAEVWKALGAGMSMAGPLLIAPPWTVAAGGLVSVDASTPHRAACRALVAAGLVPREEAHDAP